jgi:pimeloyl-ACP methyl ester carboxylesterase
MPLHSFALPGIATPSRSVHHERRAVLGAGHFLHLEQPKTVADHILGFLNS